MTNQQQPFDEEYDKPIKHWTDVKAQGEEKCKIGYQLQVKGALEAGTANYVLQAASLMNYLSPSYEWRTLTNFGEQLSNDQQKQIAGIQGYVDAGFYSTSGSASVLTEVLSAEKIQSLPSPVQQQAIDIRSNFNQFLSQDVWQKSVLEEMRKFGFDQSRRGSEAITEFNSAWSVHIPGAPSSTSALIPLREAIQKTIEELFQRRPIHKDEVGKVKEKIVEIGKSKARRKGIPLAAFKKLQIEWDGDRSKSESEKGLQNRLSYKASLGDRERERQLMIEATLFLAKLLSIVDPRKLKERG